MAQCVVHALEGLAFSRTLRSQKHSIFSMGPNRRYPTVFCRVCLCFIHRLCFYLNGVLYLSADVLMQLSSSVSSDQASLSDLFLAVSQLCTLFNDAGISEMQNVTVTVVAQDSVIIESPHPYENSRDDNQVGYVCA